MLLLQLRLLFPHQFQLHQTKQLLRAVALGRPCLMDELMMITARNPPTAGNTATATAKATAITASSVVKEIDILVTATTTVVPLIATPLPKTPRAVNGRHSTAGHSPQRRHIVTLTRSTITVENQLRICTHTTQRTTVTTTTGRRLDLARRHPLCTRSKKIAVC